MLETKATKHTLRICNNYCFSTATMITVTRLIVAFIAYCLYFFMTLLHYALSIVSYIVSHGRKTNNEVEGMTVVAYFKALRHSFPEQTVQKHGNPQKNFPTEIWTRYFWLHVSNFLITWLSLFTVTNIMKLLNLITVQQDATYSVYYISVGSSTCFGFWHPSSGARIIVITASGID